MKAFLADTKFILLFFVILTLATVLSNIDLESSKNEKMTNPLSDLKFDFGLDIMSFDVKSTKARGPASLDRNEYSILKKEFLCPLSKNKAQLKVSDRVSKNLVAINFKLCHEFKLIESISLENKSNGYKAHIFKVNKNYFKTDYIQLNSGLNQLKLNVFLKDGQKLEDSLEILSGS